MSGLENVTPQLVKSAGKNLSEAFGVGLDKIVLDPTDMGVRVNELYLEGLRGSEGKLQSALEKAIHANVSDFEFTPQGYLKSFVVERVDAGTAIHSIANMNTTALQEDIRKIKGRGGAFQAF